MYIEHSSNFSTTLRADISAITGLCLNERNLAITNQKSIAIYKIPRTDEFKGQQNPNGNASGEGGGGASIKHIQTFNVLDCMQIFIYDETVIVVGYQNVRSYSFGGIALKEINFNDNEGNCFISIDFCKRPSNVSRSVKFFRKFNSNFAFISLK